MLLAIAQNCRQLQVMSLCASVATDLGIGALAEHCPDLRQLDLTLCQNISNDCLSRLAIACPRLRHLGAGGVESLSDDVVTAWSHLQGLQSLNIRGCRNLTDHSVTALCRNANQLRVLLVS